MKLIHRSRSKARKAPRIEISEAEILADLNYPASRRRARAEAEGHRR